MKWRVIMAVAGGLFLAATMAAGEEQATLKDPGDRLSYSLGLDVGIDLKKLDVKLNPEVFLQGVKDLLSDGKKLMTDEEVRETMAAFAKVQQEKQAALLKELGEKNKKEGDAFLAENRKKEGVKTLPDGLQYKVLTEGSGKSPKATDVAVVNYKGTFINGNEFDSSYRRGQPVTLTVNGVIPGWAEALQLMKEGAKWQLFIPPNLAYGDKGVANMIAPNSTLLFEVELISVK